ncbi:hypothetical protein PoB_004120700 [Plakobranchus ocellatus]|uniref:Uncharacterized protein n=1 Tax=Plakobranchus ocellatus TaxID=259542 RepID=A0AAV4B6G9_9GAST|nr:hypothetical protein PoB_004120700 [Plakobranchus ocellatus]
MSQHASQFEEGVSHLDSNFKQGFFDMNAASEVPFDPSFFLKVLTAAKLKEDPGEAKENAEKVDKDAEEMEGDTIEVKEDTNKLEDDADKM